MAKGRIPMKLVEILIYVAIRIFFNSDRFTMR